MRPVPALLVCEWLRRARLVLAVVEVPQIVEDVIRAEPLKAGLEEDDILVASSAAGVAQRRDLDFEARFAAHGDDDRALHTTQKQTTHSNVQRLHLTQSTAMRRRE
jgi:hypothetical protein